MSGKRAFEEKLRAVDALRESGDAAALARAIHDRSNYVAARAAAIAADLQLDQLIPDLLKAYDRFFENPVKSDPQCWGKNAIAKALKNFGHRGPAPYLRGIDHFQPEPAWQGSVDSATTLRATCALALVETSLDDIEILTHLTDRLADPESTVRQETAIAVSQLGRAEGALLLRLKALDGDESEVMGQYFASLLSLTGADSVAFLTRFFDNADEQIALEAAAALAQSSVREAIPAIGGYWRRILTPPARRAVILSLGASPLDEATAFLKMIGEEGSGEVAEAAREVLKRRS